MLKSGGVSLSTDEAAMSRSRLLLALTSAWLSLGPQSVANAQPGKEDFVAWNRFAEKGSLTADETRALMKRLARFVYDNHLRQDADAPQRGMVYEYFDVARKGQFDQWVQG